MSDVDETADGLLLRAVGLALTGEEVAATGPAVGSPEERVVGWLEASGWGSERLHALRAQRQAEEQPWPFPVPPDEVRPVGFARYAAVLKAVRASLGVDGLVPTVHNGPKVIGPAELRLLAEVPPHHGNVG